jgi:hypothetical protein
MEDALFAQFSRHNCTIRTNSTIRVQIKEDVKSFLKTIRQNISQKVDCCSVKSV